MYYVAVADVQSHPFLKKDGSRTQFIDYAGQWDSFDEADTFTKQRGHKKYFIFVSARFADGYTDIGDR